MKSAKPWILGLSTGQHNGAACLCRGSRIVVAVQEERLTREKRAPIRHGRRSLAVDYCIAAAGITPANLDLVVDCRLSRFAMERDKPIELLLGNCRSVPPVMKIPHHLDHAMSAFCTSGFDESIVLVIDGAGSYGSQLFDWERAATIEFDDSRAEHLGVYEIDRHQVSCLEKHLAPMALRQSLGRTQMPLFRSLGNMFSAVAHQIFGDIFEAEKVMALAPYGTASFPPNEFFCFDGRSFKFSDAVPTMFQHGERWPLREKEYADLAASVQHALEAALAAFVPHLPKNRRLCYAGGVALNSVANHHVLARAGFEDVYVIPAAEDSGTAIGAALLWAHDTDRPAPATPPSGRRAGPRLQSK